MNVVRSNDQSSKRGPSAWFTGTVWLENLSPAGGPAAVNLVRVTFEPAARTVWHSHPAGQTIHILSGAGWVQRDGEARIEVQPGDSVWFAPGERHWHGAAPQRGMVHLAVQSEPDGRVTDWYEPVSDSDYRG